MLRCGGFLVLWLGVSTLVAQDALPEKVLRALKDATVFVRVTGATPGGRAAENSGSGFLVHRTADHGYIVTNAHVTGRVAGVAEVVFDGGTPRERLLKAEVVGADIERDLAILRVESGELPRPIELASTGPLRETQPIFVVGYPFGRALALDRGNPAVTVSKGTVSSLRDNERGELWLIQISGDINPGNSGGPIVDERGRLVGVAVAKVSHTQIGLAIPAAAVGELLNGRVSAVQLEPQGLKERRARCTVRVDLLDPLERVKGVTLLTIPATKVKERAGDEAATERGPVVAGMKEAKLKVAERSATGEIVLPIEPTQPTKYVYQVRYVDGAGTTRYTHAAELEIDPEILAADESAPAPTAKAGAPAAEPASAASAPGPEEEGPTEDWLGDPEQKKKRQAAAAGEPIATGTSYLGEARDVVDARVTALTLPAGQVLPNMLWSADAKSVYVLERTGVLHKLSVPTFVEERQFLIGQACTALERCAAGLVVVVQGLQELWVFDPDTLRVAKRIAVPEVFSVWSAPSLRVGWAGSHQPTTVSVVDFERGQVVGTLAAREFYAQEQKGAKVKSSPNSRPPHAFEVCALTPDAKYFLLRCGGVLHRFRVRGGELVYEERGPELNHMPRINLSPDGRYVVSPAGVNVPHAGHPPLPTGGGLYVYRVTDLSVPVMAIPLQSYCASFAFDKVGERLYAADGEGRLNTFTPQGVPQKAYPLGQSGEAGQQVLVHPQGHRLLFVSDRQLCWVELP